jgi:hypothetical protein
METRKKNKVKKVSAIMLIAFIMTLTLAFSVTPRALAGEYIEGKPDAVLNKGQVVEDDLFMAGEDVLVAGTVEGDLFAFGENVDISGEVYGNVFTAGATVNVSGRIGGALMIAGYDLTLDDSAKIDRNVYFGGFSFQSMENSVVNRSIYGGGYQLILDGAVNQDITAGLGAMDISGQVGGDINVEIGEPTDKTNVPYAYWSPGMPSVKVLQPGYVVDENQVDGDVNIKVTKIDTDIDKKIQIEPGFFVLRAMRRRTGEFIALMLVGMLGLWLIKGTLLKAVEEIKTNAGMDTIWGILVYILYLPVVFILFLVLLTLTILVSIFTLGNLAGEMITVSSFSFFGLLSLFGMLAGIATKVVLGYLVGRWILEKVSKLSFENYWHHVVALVTGIFLYEIVRIIPVLGWLMMAIVVVIGTGAFFAMIKNALQGKKSSSKKSIEATPV